MSPPLPGSVSLCTARSGEPSLPPPYLVTQPCVDRYPWLWYPMGAKLPLSSSHGRWEQFDKKYLSQLLMRKSAYRLRDEIWDVYYKLNIRDAISFVDQVPAVMVSRQQDGPGRRGSPHVWPHMHPLAGQWASAHPSWVLAVLMSALSSQGGHVLSAAKLALPSMPSRTSMSESSVTNLL